MELPVVNQGPQSGAAALVRAIQRADAVLARTAAQETELAGGVAFTNPRRPDVHMLNCAAELRVAEGLSADGVLAEVRSHFESAGVRCHRLGCAEHDWPADLAPAAERAGYRRESSLLMAWTSPRPAERLNERLQIIPARAAFAEVRRLFARCAAARHRLDDHVAGQLADTHLDFLDEPRLESFLGRLDGRPAGVVSVLTLGNIGVVTDVNTDPDHRRQRVAATLLSAALDYCRRAFFQQVILETEEGCPAVALYESLGFTRVGALDRYRL